MQTSLVCSSNQGSLISFQQSWNAVACDTIFIWFAVLTTFKNIQFISNFCSFRKFLLQLSSFKKLATFFNFFLRKSTVINSQITDFKISAPEVFACAFCCTDLYMVDIWHILNEATRLRTCTRQDTIHIDTNLTFWLVSIWSFNCKGYRVPLTWLNLQRSSFIITIELISICITTFNDSCVIKDGHGEILIYFGITRD